MSNDNKQINSNINLQYSEYSIKLGSTKWSDLSDHAEKIDACYINEDELKKMSTDKIIELVLDYPLLIDIFSYDSLQKGMEVVSTYCNPLHELEGRNDAGLFLLKEYIEQDIADVFQDSIAPENNNSEFLQICITEILLAQPKINQDLSLIEKKQLENEIEQKDLERNADSRFGISRYIYEQVKQGVEKEKAFRTIGDGKKSGSISTVGITQINYSYSPFPIYTPRGTAIYPIIASNDFTTTEKRDIDNQYRRGYPNATYLSTSTAKYNCHSYAWHSQSVDNGLWINSPSAYWNDGSYTYIGQAPTANGQKVYYDRSGTEHSGVVTNYSTKKITSKWGQGPLMLHNEKDCPYYSVAWAQLPNIKYYR